MWKLVSGRKHGHGLKNIVILLLLVLAPSWGLYSASALDELTLILSDYERVTESLQIRLDNSETELQSLKISIGQAKMSAKDLENSLTEQSKALGLLSQSLTTVQQTSDSLQKQTENLLSGYKSMERSLKVSKAVNNVLIVAVLVLAGGVVYSLVVP